MCGQGTQKLAQCYEFFDLDLANVDFGESTSVRKLDLCRTTELGGIVVRLTIWGVQHVCSVRSYQRLGTC